MDGYIQHKLVEFTWADKATGTGHAPATDHIVDLRQADSFELQVDSSDAANASADIDITVLRSLDVDTNGASATWDTTSQDLVTAHGDNSIKTYHITSIVGGWAKLRLDNNDAGAATVTVRLKKRTKV